MEWINDKSRLSALTRLFLTMILRRQLITAPAEFSAGAVFNLQEIADLVRQRFALFSVNICPGLSHHGVEMNHVYPLFPIPEAKAAVDKIISVIKRPSARAGE